VFYKIGNSRVVHNGSVFVFVLFGLWQFISSRREPIYRARIYEYTHEMGNECTCAVKWICVFDDVKTRN